MGPRSCDRGEAIAEFRADIANLSFNGAAVM